MCHRATPQKAYSIKAQMLTPCRWYIRCLINISWMNVRRFRICHLKICYYDIRIGLSWSQLRGSRHKENSVFFLSIRRGRMKSPISPETDGTREIHITNPIKAYHPIIFPHTFTFPVCCPSKPKTFPLSYLFSTNLLFFVKMLRKSKC